MFDVEEIEGETLSQDEIDTMGFGEPTPEEAAEPTKGEVVSLDSFRDK